MIKIFLKLFVSLLFRLWFEKLDPYSVAEAIKLRNVWEAFDLVAPLWIGAIAGGNIDNLDSVQDEARRQFSFYRVLKALEG